MSYVQVFSVLAETIVELSLFYWPVSIILVALILLSLSYGRSLAPVHPRSKHLILFLPLLCTALILVIGTLTGHRSHPQWTTWIILLLFLIQPLISLIIVVGVLPLRLFTVAVLMLEMWVGLICCFAASLVADGMRL